MDGGPLLDPFSRVLPDLTSGSRSRDQTPKQTLLGGASSLALADRPGPQNRICAVALLASGPAHRPGRTRRDRVAHQRPPACPAGQELHRGDRAPARPPHGVGPRPRSAPSRGRGRDGRHAPGHLRPRSRDGGRRQRELGGASARRRQGRVVHAARADGRTATDPAAPRHRRAGPPPTPGSGTGAGSHADSVPRRRRVTDARPCRHGVTRAGTRECRDTRARARDCRTTRARTCGRRDAHARPCDRGITRARTRDRENDHPRTHEPRITRPPAHERRRCHPRARGLGSRLARAPGRRWVRRRARSRPLGCRQLSGR